MTQGYPNLCNPKCVWVAEGGEGERRESKAAPSKAVALYMLLPLAELSRCHGPEQPRPANHLTNQPASQPASCPCTIHDPPLCQQQLKKSEGRSRGERGKKSNFCWVVLSSSCPGISSRVFPGKGDRSGGRYSSRWICYFAVDPTEVLANLAHKSCTTWAAGSKIRASLLHCCTLLTSETVERPQLLC